MDWQIPAAIACALVAGFVARHLPGRTTANVSGDTVTLVNGTRSIAYCLSHGIHSSCDQPSHQVGPFPLFQYVPAFALTQLVGTSNAGAFKGLTLLSALSFCALVVLSAWTVSQTRRRWAPAATVLILTTSPLIYYAWSTFGESFASLLVALLAIATLRRWRPGAIALTAFLACITKETVFPIIAILGAIGLWATPIGTRPLRRAHWIGLVTGILLGIAAGAALNWFRYDQLTNANYLAPDLQVPGLGRRLGLSVTLWVAPNAGVAVFWPLATALVIGLIAIVVVAMTRRPVAWRRITPAFGLIAALLILTGTLASFYSPFGWFSWGPRLTLPTMPATIVIAIVIYGREFEGALRRVLHGRIRFAIVALIVIALGLPQVNVLHQNAVTGEIFAPDRTCPTQPIIQQGRAYWYRCLDHRAWAVHWILPDTFRSVEGVWGVIFAGSFVLLWGWLLVVAKPEERSESLGARRPLALARTAD